MENLMPIGEFASASRLSQKALRLYGEKGLLPPAWVDPDSGYRYYGVNQLQEATLIALLRRAGMPLVEIRSFLRDPTVERLEAFEHDVTDEFAERRRVLRYVKRVLKEETMYDVLTKRVDEQPYVSRKKRVRVPELIAFISEGFDALGDAEGGRPFVLYHGAVNTEEDGPVEVCIPKAVGEKRLPAGEVAFTEISGSQCDFPEILGAYEAVFRWAKEHGREVDGPAREIYLNGAGEELQMEIAVPLR
ncbi:MAG TPA: MerR family transcriptional regulator [Gaiellaceae bacterium]|jgi:DNA-binding transcriptional MerR regulator|nr:MerR family transcriptional regulator [Gaiellaceae bacterium]